MRIVDTSSAAGSAEEEIVVSCCTALRSPPFERRWPDLIDALDAPALLVVTTSSSNKLFRSVAIFRKTFDDDDDDEGVTNPDFLCLFLLIAREVAAIDGLLVAPLNAARFDLDCSKDEQAAVCDSETTIEVEVAADDDVEPEDVLLLLGVFELSCKPEPMPPPLHDLVRLLRTSTSFAAGVVAT